MSYAENRCTTSLCSSGQVCCSLYDQWAAATNATGSLTTLPAPPSTVLVPPWCCLNSNYMCGTKQLSCVQSPSPTSSPAAKSGGGAGSVLVPVVVTIGALLFIGLVIFFLWRRRAYMRDKEQRTKMIGETAGAAANGSGSGGDGSRGTDDVKSEDARLEADMRRAANAMMRDGPTPPRADATISDGGSAGAAGRARKESARPAPLAATGAELSTVSALRRAFASDGAAVKRVTSDSDMSAAEEAAAAKRREAFMKMTYQQSKKQVGLQGAERARQAAERFSQPVVMQYRSAAAVVDEAADEPPGLQRKLTLPGASSSMAEDINTYLAARRGGAAAGTHTGGPVVVDGNASPRTAGTSALDAAGLGELMGDPASRFKAFAGLSISDAPVLSVASIGTESAAGSAALTPSGQAAANVAVHSDDGTAGAMVSVPREDAPPPVVVVGGGDEDDGAPIHRGNTEAYSPREGNGLQQDDVEMREFDGSRMLRSQND